MTKVLVDGIHVSSGMKGVGRYVVNTMNALVMMGDGAGYTVLTLQGTNHGVDCWKNVIECVHIGWRNHLWHALVELPGQVSRLTPDVVWVP